MEDSTRLGYCIVAGSFVAFQFSFSALSPQLSLSLSPSYATLPSVKQNEWNSRCVSTLHAVIVGLFCLYILWFDDAVNANPIWGDPWLVKLNVAITCGYLVYDLLLLLRYWRTLGDSLFVCHHLAALYAYGYVLSRGVLPYFANFRLISELSTPFVNLRWFLDTAGWPRSSHLVLANGLAMTVVFFLPSCICRTLPPSSTIIPHITVFGKAEVDAHCLLVAVSSKLPSEAKKTIIPSSGNKWCKSS
ncbi:TLC domain-containing protein 4-B isoform X2 [Pogona vitticeps]